MERLKKSSDQLGRKEANGNNAKTNIGLHMKFFTAGDCGELIKISGQETTHKETHAKKALTQRKKRNKKVLS